MHQNRHATASQLVQQAGALPLALLGAMLAAAPLAAQPAAEAPKVKDDAGKAKVKVSEHMTVDLHVKDEAIGNVLELLSIQSQKNIVASKNVNGKVSADLYSVTFVEALDAILHVNGFVWMEKGNFIYVYTREEFDQIRKATTKRQAKVIRLNYLSGSDAAEFVKPLLSEGAEIKTTKATEAFTIPENAPTGKDDFALGATMVVIDYEENIEAIEKLLIELDTKPVQVLVAATVLQTAITEDNAFGVDLSFIGDLNFTDFVGLGGARNAASSLIEGGGGAPPQGISRNKGQAVSSTPGRTSGRSTLKIGIISNSVAAFVRLLDEVTDTTVLSNPRLLTLNRQAARVLVGERVAYLSTTQTETSQTQTVEFLDTGVQLYFRPFVSNTNEIRMELKPQVSSATPVNIQAGSGQVTVPNESTQELVTNVIVRDGMTVVLGGLFTESTTRARSQVPVIGDIPIIGAAFRGHEDSINRSEIIFLVTPTIVNDKLLIAGGLEGNRTVERVRAGSRQGLLPFSQEKMTSTLNVEAERLAREGQTDQALWNLQRSLSIRPLQPDAMALRDRIQSDKEVWPTRSLLSDVLDAEVQERLDRIPKAPAGTPHQVPFSHENIHRIPADTPPLRSSAEPNPAIIAAANEPASTTSPASVNTTPADAISTPAAPQAKPLVNATAPAAFVAAPTRRNRNPQTNMPLVIVDQGIAHGFIKAPNVRRSHRDPNAQAIANAPAAKATVAASNPVYPPITAEQKAKRTDMITQLTRLLDTFRVKRNKVAEVPVDAPENK